MASVSCGEISTWLRCPLAYWCQRQPELRVVVRPRPYLAFGEIVHRTLRCFYALPPGHRVPSALWACYERCWADAAQEGQAAAGLADMAVLKEQYYGSGKDLLGRYLERMRPREVRVRFLEVTMSLPVGGQVVRGRVDRVDELEGGVLRVVDYKTGHFLVSPRLDIAARTYALMVLRQLKPPALVVSYDYLGAGQELVAEYGAEDVNVLEPEVGGLVERLTADKLFLPLANPLCRGCDFRPLCPECPVDELLTCPCWDNPVGQVEELGRRHHLPGLWRRVAQARLFAGDHEAALQAANRAVEAAPRYVWARYQLAAVLMARGRHGEAAAQLRAAWQELQDPAAVAVPSGTVRMEVGLALVEALLSQAEAVLPEPGASVDQGEPVPVTAEAAHVLSSLSSEAGLLDDGGGDGADVEEVMGRENAEALPNLYPYRARLTQLKARLDLITGSQT